MSIRGKSYGGTFDWLHSYLHILSYIPCFLSICDTPPIQSKSSEWPSRNLLSQILHIDLNERVLQDTFRVTSYPYDMIPSVVEVRISAAKSLHSNPPLSLTYGINMAHCSFVVSMHFCKHSLDICIEKCFTVNKNLFSGFWPRIAGFWNKE